jgi:hypothetical protein
MIAIENGIHIGAKTHNHDQFIIFNNFNVMNTTANKPVNPIPLDDELLDIINLLNYLYYLEYLDILFVFPCFV